ncbi:hypothetical protein D3C71_1860360 [compost metagenome]
MWRNLRWTTPRDVLCNHELEETTIDELAAIMDALELELYDAPIYRKVFGVELINQEESVISEWLTTTDAALEAVRQAQAAVRAIQRASAPRRIESFGLVTSP